MLHRLVPGLGLGARRQGGQHPGEFVGIDTGERLRIVVAQFAKGPVGQHDPAGDVEHQHAFGEGVEGVAHALGHGGVRVQVPQYTP